MLKIRKAVTKDLERIPEIYACAREVMKNSGNPDRCRGSLWSTISPQTEHMSWRKMS